MSANFDIQKDAWIGRDGHARLLALPGLAIFAVVCLCRRRFARLWPIDDVFCQPGVLGPDYQGKVVGR